MTLTLEEAIRLLRDYKMQSNFAATPYFEAALQLGIEALKHYQGDKEIGCIRSDYFLPGETEGET